jgi:hypothetical protein
LWSGKEIPALAPIGFASGSIARQLFDQAHKLEPADTEAASANAAVVPFIGPRAGDRNAKIMDFYIDKSVIVYLEERIREIGSIKPSFPLRFTSTH